MNLVPDNETGGFCVTWTIQNFSFCLQQKGESIESPLFTTFHTQKSSKWNIGMYPRGTSTPGTISCFLRNMSDENITEISYVFSIRTISGFYKRNAILTQSFEAKQGFGNLCLIKHRDLNKLGDDAFLENDTLTIRCRIWINGPQPVIGQCDIRTIIQVEHISFIWCVENFQSIQNKSTTTDVQQNSIETPFTLSLSLTEESFAEQKIQIEIKQIKTLKQFFLTGDIALLTPEEKVIQSVYDEHSFQKSEDPQIWKLPFMSIGKLATDMELYLPNDTLSLHCKFAISTGAKYSEIESCKYGEIEDTHVSNCGQSKDFNSSASLSADLQHFFQEHKFTDFIIRTPGKDFPVHKTILCARSAVFSAMFEHDTKERRTNVVEIQDVGDDTVTKMLLFVYTDIVDKDIKWENASKLYSAADKYEITELKRKCANFLKDNLNTKNVCDILNLSDMHQDDVMKSAAQNFIVDRATQFMMTEEWKNFMKDRGPLALETMHLVITRNFKK